ncbi:uncharacterized protein DNG_01641 [Cephalotrichum gorgonifer]|uniref:Protein-S-isoprenylcysteine O-methyltransferase n=1 Tax=Cephalotrichum gorgonifer TaxID=2041049 RepID=A0AAE8MR92_9PEZI|nr:uncharacterized protein DNG_01641 [Cephalotrichum gorgonifer]
MAFSTSLSQASLAAAVLASTVGTYIALSPPNPTPTTPDSQAPVSDSIRRFKLASRHTTKVVLAPLGLLALHTSSLAYFHPDIPSSLLRYGAENRLDTSLVTWSAATAIPLTLILAAGVPLRLVSHASLGKNFTFALTKPDQLKTDDIYRYVQHPGYTGILVLVLSNAALLYRTDGALSCWIPPSWYQVARYLGWLAAPVGLGIVLAGVWTRVRQEEPSPNQQTRSVNDLLANLRHTSTPPHQRTNHQVASPSLPPAIRHILQLPETPAPAPRGPRNRLRLDARGRRLPAGPPPPRSWQTATGQSNRARDGADRRAPGAIDGGRVADALPGEYVPVARGLVDIVLRVLMREWPTIGPHEELALWTLPDGTRQALLRYLDIYRGGDVTLGDVRAVLVPDEEDPEAGLGNAHFTHLRVPSALLTASNFPSLISTLLPKPSKTAPQTDEPHESWEAADALTPGPPGRLLPALTHLSLALDPSSRSSKGAPSWRHLLQLASRLPGLTHLNLAFWPEPTRTPNARYASVVGPQGNRVQYGGTTMYSHSLDDDWSEAVNILRALSKRLYQLEYLDITGCGAWFPALVKSEDAALDSGGEGEEVGVRGVDWRGDWGKVAVVRMTSGVRITGEESQREKERYRAGIEAATELERHITAQRAGTGRIITVERDDLYALR